MIGFFAADDRLERLTELGDTLNKIQKVVDFETFRPLLNELLPSFDTRAGGRQRLDRVMMFKILILQSLYNIADDSVEFQINDRLSFQRFLGFDISTKVPDAKTIWAFRDNLQKTGRYKELFDLYTKKLEECNIITHSGSIIDATVVERTPNKKKENRSANSEKQIDKDANWTKKHGKWHCGYKAHVKADLDSKLIVDFTVTPASVHDSQEAHKLIDETDQEAFMDKGYDSPKLRRKIKSRNKKVVLHIAKSARRNKPLTTKQENENQKHARKRSRIEHIFGIQARSMGGKFVRCVGLLRARFAITLKNLAYNFKVATRLFR